MVLQNNSPKPAQRCFLCPTLKRQSVPLRARYLLSVRVLESLGDRGLSAPNDGSEPKRAPTPAGLCSPLALNCPFRKPDKNIVPPLRAKSSASRPTPLGGTGRQNPRPQVGATPTSPAGPVFSYFDPRRPPIGAARAKKRGNPPTLEPTLQVSACFEAGFPPPPGAGPSAFDLTRPQPWPPPTSFSHGPRARSAPGPRRRATWPRVDRPTTIKPARRRYAAGHNRARGRPRYEPRGFFRQFKAITRIGPFPPRSTRVPRPPTPRFRNHSPAAIPGRQPQPSGKPAVRIPANERP